MNTMRYKGYTARIDFDGRESIFVGRVLGVRDAISFHGATVAALRRDFHAAVEHYLALCAKRGETPEKPYSGKLMLRVPPDVHARAAIAAEARGESLNQWATQVLRLAAER
jgi:predicted HicB family RNase H-like nuclease